VACAGQALHWFANPIALREIRRVLKPTGRLGLIWNRLDRSSTWASAISRIVDRFKGDAPKYEDGRWKTAFDRLSSFQKTIGRTFGYGQTADLATVLTVLIRSATSRS